MRYALHRSSQPLSNASDTHKTMSASSTRLYDLLLSHPSSSHNATVARMLSVRQVPKSTHGVRTSFVGTASVGRYPPSTSSVASVEPVSHTHTASATRSALSMHRATIRSSFLIIRVRITRVIFFLFFLFFLFFHGEMRFLFLGA